MAEIKEQIKTAKNENSHGEFYLQAIFFGPT